MAQLPPLFEDIKIHDKSELINSLAQKAPRNHKDMLIAHVFNPESSYIETFVEHCERAETMDDISGAKFAASDEDSKPRKKNRLKSKDEHGKKR